RLNDQLDSLEAENKSLLNDSAVYKKLLDGVERHSYEKLSETLGSTEKEIEEITGDITLMKKEIARKEALEKEISKKSTEIQQSKFDYEKNNDKMNQLKERLEEFKAETSFDGHSDFQNYMDRQKEAVRKFKLEKGQLEAQQDELNKALTEVTQSLKHSRDSLKENQSAIVAQSKVVDSFPEKEPFIDRSELRQILSRTDIAAKEQEVRAFHQEKSSTDQQISDIEKELVQK